MVLAPLSPRNGHFLVQLPGDHDDRELVFRIARRIGRIETLPERFGGAFALLPALHPEDPRESWDALRTALTLSRAVLPVLGGPDGSGHFPNGWIRFRFKATPSDERLANFAKRHALAEVERSAHIDEECRAKPRSPETTYLPDILEEVRGDPEIMAVWPGLFSRCECKTPA